MPVHYEIYSDAALYHCLHRLQKEIDNHENKIRNPETYIKNWNDRNVYYKEGIVKYWQREIEKVTSKNPSFLSFSYKKKKEKKQKKEKEF